MKAKLIKIREALEYQSNMAINGMASHRDCIYGSCINTTAIVDELLAMMDSPELVAAKMNRELSKNKPINQAMLGLSYIPVAQAAINSIMGE